MATDHLHSGYVDGVVPCIAYSVCFGVQERGQEMRKLLVVLVAIAATASACGGSSSDSLGGNAIAKAVKAGSGQKADVQQGGAGATVKTDDGPITLGANGDSTDITGTDAQGLSVDQQLR